MGIVIPPSPLEGLVRSYEKRLVYDATKITFFSLFPPNYNTMDRENDYLLLDILDETGNIPIISLIHLLLFIKILHDEATFSVCRVS
jgi:hypothetical protein